MSYSVHFSPTKLNIEPLIEVALRDCLLDFVCNRFSFSASLLALDLALALTLSLKSKLHKLHFKWRVEVAF